MAYICIYDTIGTPLATFSLGLDLLFSSPLIASHEYCDVLETMKTARDMMTLTRKKAMDYFRSQAGMYTHLRT